MFKAVTDLAVEAREAVMERYSKTHKGDIDGIKYSERTDGIAGISVIDVINENGEREIGRKKGKYVTVSFPDVMNLGFEEFSSLCDVCAREILSVCRGLTDKIESVLVCGLGNEKMTPDCIGPESVKNVLVTRHLKNSDSALFKKTGLFDICAFLPGVGAVTGLDSSDILLSVVKEAKPDIVIAVDALAARETSRLCKTLQICSAGISPGSGVGNAKRFIDKETLGVPVVAVGIPTVVDTATLVRDAIGEDKAELLNGYSGLFVCPKEIDELSTRLSRLIGYAVNRAFHKELSFEEIIML